MTLLLPFVLVAGCTVAVHGEEAFRRQAERRLTSAPTPVEEAYRCFLSRGINPGYQQLYPERGEAVWSFTAGGTFLSLVTFRRVQANLTEVEVFGLRGGDSTHWPEVILNERVMPCLRG